jgi:hypothetical protein
MQVLVASFALAALAIALIVGLVGCVAQHHPTPWVLRGERVLLATICIVLAILAGRVLAIERAFFALLDVNRRHALLVARSKTQGSRDETLGRWKQDRFTPDSLDHANTLEDA